MARRVGLFDSGVGGLSVWRAIAASRPDFDLFYLADQAHIPYGGRPAEQIQEWSAAIVSFLFEQGCEAIVVACNTASAAALERLRHAFPDRPIVGMEPAIKPAAGLTRRGVVGVLATPTTLQGDLFTNTLERFAGGVRVVRQVCPGLVECIESGDVDGPRTRRLLQECLAPLREAGADTIVLACTHYAFVQPAIESIVGPEGRIVDPAPAIARQLERVLDSSERSEVRGRSCFWTTGDAAEFERVAGALIGDPVSARALHWRTPAGAANPLLQE